MQHRPTLLVVEDDDTLGRMLARMFGEFATVVSAHDGREALDWLSSAVPAAVVTDRAMPRLDGVALVRAMKADPRLRSVPVLMLTAHGGVRATVEAINAGVRLFVEKPFRTADLTKKVRKLVTESPRPPCLAPTILPPPRTAEPSIECDVSGTFADLELVDDPELLHDEA